METLRRQKKHHSQGGSGPAQYPKSSESELIQSRSGNLKQGNSSGSKFTQSKHSGRDVPRKFFTEMKSAIEQYDNSDNIKYGKLVRFVAEDVESAMKKVFQALGDDAMLHETNRTPAGVEIIASCDVSSLPNYQQYQHLASYLEDIQGELGDIQNRLVALDRLLGRFAPGSLRALSLVLILLFELACFFIFFM